MQFLYQALADPQIFKIPEFDSIGEYDLESVQECIFELDNTPILDDVAAIMPDFFDPYHDDILELTRPLDTFESGSDSEAWFGLNVPPEPYDSIQHNFGKPYSPGKWGRPGDYLFPYAYSTNGMLLVADIIYYVPLYVPYQMRIVEFGIWINTRDDSGEARLGIYGSERGIIGKRIYSNIISLNTTGYRSVPADIWLTEGLYFLALISNSNIVEVRVSDIDDKLLAIPHPDYNNTYKHYIENGNYTSGLPEIAGDTVIKNDNTPRIIVRLG